MFYVTLYTHTYIPLRYVQCLIANFIWYSSILEHNMNNILEVQEDQAQEFFKGAVVEEKILIS